jgi:thiol-disulfide isomerase/thioredoxin
MTNNILFIHFIMSINVTLYHANWCGHCQEFMPEWKNFEKKIKSNGNVKIQAIEESTLSRDNMPKINGKDIRGFPTIKISKGNKEIDYNGERTANALSEYLDKM